MKHLSGYNNKFESEAWYFWGSTKVLLGDLDWGLGTKGPQSDPADKTFLGLCIVSNVSKWSNLLLKMGQTLPSLAPVLQAISKFLATIYIQVITTEEDVNNLVKISTNNTAFLNVLEQ